MTSADELTAEEIDAAKRMGLSVTRCLICKRPTLYALSAERPVAPITCGSVPCLEKFGEKV